MGIWLLQIFFLTPLAISCLSKEAGGYLQIFIPLLSGLVRRVEIVINKDEVFRGTGQDMLHVQKV